MEDSRLAIQHILNKFGVLGQTFIGYKTSSAILQKAT